MIFIEKKTHTLNWKKASYLFGNKIPKKVQMMEDHGRTQHEKQNFIVSEFCDSNKKNSYTHCKSQNQHYQQ